MSRFPHLLQPFKLGSIELKNRMVMLSMGVGYDEAGKPSQRLTNFLSERARGGVGMMITSLSFYPRLGSGILDASRDDYLPELRSLTSSVHRYGVPIIGQLLTIHTWRRDRNAPHEIVGPSEVAVRPNSIKPRALKLEEIELILNQYEDSARRVREAGFDGIELMAGIGGLISRFLSPCANQRNDQYGGSFEKRMRFPIEVIKRVKKGAGEDFAVGFRYSGHEFLDGGYDLEGAKLIGKRMAEEGVSWLNIQVGWHDSPVPLITKEVPEGHFSYLSESIKKSVNIPVISAYRITDPSVAERILSQGKADLIGMARAFIADPEYANKVKQGRADNICPCICCCRCIDQCVAAERPLDICSVNPRVGVDLESNIEPTPNSKKVLVIGGGPAGMQAAKIAATRGHRVWLYERGPRLGGAMVFGGILNRQIPKFTAYFEGQLRQLPININLEKEVNASTVEEVIPDVVLIAAGGSAISLTIPGCDGDNVSSLRDAMGLVTGRLAKRKGLWHRFLWVMGLFSFRHLYYLPFLRWALGSTLLFGKNVAIVGGGFAACELAEFLIEHGKNITIISEDSRIGTDIGRSVRWVVMMKLRKAKANIINEAKPVRITQESVQIIRRGVEAVIKIDSLITALGMKENQDLIRELADRKIATYSLGDCVEPGKIAEANKAGYRIGLKL